MGVCEMSDNETYNGYTNRETWAFNLHWQNSQGLYYTTVAVAREVLGLTISVTDWNAGENPSDYVLGERVVEYWRDEIDRWTPDTGLPLPEDLRMMRDEVGSWWRIDYAEVGAAVRESLENES
jgi:hypothetical protein